MIWLVFALLTGAAVMAVLAPLAFRNPSPDEAAGDVAFFEAQIAEIAREKTEGRLAADEAEAAKAEAARRLLRAQEKPDAGAKAPSRRRAVAVAIAAIALIPALSLALYWRLGHVDLPDLPLEARLQTRPDQLDLAGAVARIETHLREHPDDGRGFEVIAPYYMRAGRMDDGVHAFSEALRLLGPTATRHAALGEARAAAAGGEVTPAARADFDAALALEPKLPIARYFLGLGAAQTGEAERAADIWNGLLADAPPGAPWAELVRRQLDALKAEPQASAQGAAIAAMPQGARQDAIRTMVARLAARLTEKGGGVDDWLKLIRAYSVLADADNARATVTAARKALASNNDSIQRIEALARELNIVAAPRDDAK